MNQEPYYLTVGDLTFLRLAPMSEDEPQRYYRLAKGDWFTVKAESDEDLEWLEQIRREIEEAGRFSLIRTEYRKRRWWQFWKKKVPIGYVFEVEETRE